MPVPVIVDGYNLLRTRGEEFDAESRDRLVTDLVRWARARSRKVVLVFDAQKGGTREAREMKRYVFSGAAIADLDKQGRVVVPPALAEHAGIGKDVIVAGVHDHIEIWDRSAWASQLSAIEGSAGDVAERLADRRS